MQTHAQDDVDMDTMTLSLLRDAPSLARVVIGLSLGESEHVLFRRVGNVFVLNRLFAWH